MKDASSGSRAAAPQATGVRWNMCGKCSCCACQEKTEASDQRKQERCGQLRRMTQHIPQDGDATTDEAHATPITVSPIKPALDNKTNHQVLFMAVADKCFCRPPHHRGPSASSSPPPLNSQAHLFAWLEVLREPGEPITRRRPQAQPQRHSNPPRHSKTTLGVFPRCTNTSARSRPCWQDLITTTDSKDKKKRRH